jgi:hypothetical protein
MRRLFDPKERTRHGAPSRSHEPALYRMSRALDLTAAKRRNSRFIVLT